MNYGMEFPFLPYVCQVSCVKEQKGAGGTRKTAPVSFPFAVPFPVLKFNFVRASWTLINSR